MLIRAKLVTEADVAKALERMSRHSGRLGDNLVAIGAIQQKTLDAFLHRIPAEPADMAAVGIDEVDLMGLLMKLIYWKPPASSWTPSNCPTTLCSTWWEWL